MITVHTEDSCGAPVMMSGTVYPEVWRDMILDIAEANGIPITASVDEVKVGKGLAGLGVKPIPCVVVSHKQNPGKYIKIVGALDKMGNLTYASKYLAGSSSSLRSQKAAAVVAAGMRGATGDGRNMVSSVLGKLSQRNQQKEEMYYDAVHAIMQEALDLSVGREPVTLPKPPAPPKPQPQPKPQPSPQPRTQPQTQSQPRPQPKPQSRAQTQPRSQTQSQPKPQPRPVDADRIIFTCPKCAKVYRTAKKPVRVAFTCKQCSHHFTVDCSRSTR